MKLTLILVGACSALLRFDISGPGDWWVISTRDGYSSRVEASGYAPVACHVTVPVDVTGGMRIFSVRFDQDPD